MEKIYNFIQIVFSFCTSTRNKLFFTRHTILLLFVVADSVSVFFSFVSFFSTGRFYCIFFLFVLCTKDFVFVFVLQITHISNTPISNTQQQQPHQAAAASAPAGAIELAPCPSTAPSTLPH